MSDILEKMPEVIAKYQKELAEDTELTIYNIKEKSMMVSSLRAKWVGYYTAEKLGLDRIRQMKQDYQNKLMSNSMSKDPLQRLKGGDAIQDEKVKKLDGIRKQIELALEIIQKALDILQDMNFQIKNSIDLFKLNNQ